MYGLDEFDEDDSTGTVFRDVILLALIGFVAIVIMLLVSPILVWNVYNARKEMK